jgi:CheY-like chemotaxis protein
LRAVTDDLMGSRAAPPACADGGLILLVEDDAVLRTSLTEVLRHHGYEVECATNGLDALQRLQEQPRPSLILLDVMMPYMDGLEFRSLQRATRATADIPVIVITAVGMRPEIARELQLDRTFFKPLDVRRLLATIKEQYPITYAP